MQTIALAALHAGDQGDHRPRDGEWSERLFLELMKAPTQVPAPPADPQFARSVRVSCAPPMATNANASHASASS